MKAGKKLQDAVARAHANMVARTLLREAKWLIAAYNSNKEHLKRKAMGES